VVSINGAIGHKDARQTLTKGTANHKGVLPKYRSIFETTTCNKQFSVDGSTNGPSQHNNTLRQQK
jgi:hypothetical protein